MISMNLINRALRPIGLDIGHSSIKMIQLKVEGDHLAVHAADQVNIDPEINNDEQKRRKYIVESIKQILSKGNFHGKKVVSCLQSGQLKITSLRLNETDEDKTEQILRKETFQRFGLNPDVDAIDYIIAGNVRQGEEVKNEYIVLATDNNTVKNHIEMLELAGLKPVAIDAIPCALFRSFERSMRRQEDWENTAIYIDLGSSCTTVVFGRSGEISFVKQIEIGGNSLNQQIASKLGISITQAEMLRSQLREEEVTCCRHKTDGDMADTVEESCDNIEDASNQRQSDNENKMDSSTRQVIVDAINSVAEQLAGEISLCLKYYTVTFRGRRVERAILAGGCANEKILLDVLRRQLSVNIEIAAPLRGFDLSNDRSNLNFKGDRRSLLCEWAVAVGLGLKGWSSAKSASLQN
jgi:type IV pilus assembly protein PilM